MCDICGNPEWVLFVGGKVFCPNCAFLLELFSGQEEEALFDAERMLEGKHYDVE